MARKFRDRMVRSGRQTFWLGGTFVRSTIAAGNGVVIQTSLNAAALALRPFTIVRTRGLVSVMSDQIAAIEHQEIAFGAIVVSDQSVAIGVTAVPTPLTDSQSDWHVYQVGMDQFDFITGAGFQSNVGKQYEIDSKAMRKVAEGQDLIQVAETDSHSESAIVTSFTRVLIKLH